MGTEAIDFEENAGLNTPIYLLDTAPLLWVIADPDRLSKTASDIWRSAERLIAVSVISYWEIALKKEKLGIHDVAWWWEHRVLPYVDIDPIQVRGEHITELLLLPQVHKDPFDRMLIAQTRVEHMCLVTPDKHIRNYDVLTVWY